MSRAKLVHLRFDGFGFFLRAPILAAQPNYQRGDDQQTCDEQR